MPLLIRMCVSLYCIDTEGADLVWPIVKLGMNERFAGASAGTRFGAGSYFSDDAGKADQYVTGDKMYNAAKVLHQRLYSDSSGHPGNIFYVFVVRVTLGHSVKHAEKGDQCFNPISKIGNTWRELANIPNHDRPYNSLFAAAGAGNTRYSYNEYVIFHSDQTYPEYLLAYHRR
jgi:hypothetical protein